MKLEEALKKLSALKGAATRAYRKESDSEDLHEWKYQDGRCDAFDESIKIVKKIEEQDKVYEITIDNTVKNYYTAKCGKCGEGLDVIHCSNKEVDVRKHFSIPKHCDNCGAKTKMGGGR
jgi:hypothetical protein